MTRPSGFKKTDFIRAVRAAQAAGLRIARVETDDGKIIVVVSDKPDERRADDPLDQEGLGL